MAVVASRSRCGVDFVVVWLVSGGVIEMTVLSLCCEVAVIVSPWMSAESFVCVIVTGMKVSVFVLVSVLVSVFVFCSGELVMNT